MAAQDLPLVCELCQVNEAGHFCDCQVPLVYVCLNCFDRHSAKNPDFIHQIKPVSAQRQHSGIYVSKYEALDKNITALRSNLEEIEHFCSEFDELMKNSITYLTEYRSQWLQHMQTEKGELHAAIEAAVKETIDSLEQGTGPASALAMALWTLPPAELQICSYLVTVPDFPKLCDTWVCYQNKMDFICERFDPQIPRQFFAAVARNALELYDSASQQITQHTFAVDFARGACYIQVDRRTLFCLGAEPASTAIYALDTPSMNFTSLPPMYTPRGAAGAAKGLTLKGV